LQFGPDHSARLTLKLRSHRKRCVAASYVCGKERRNMPHSAAARRIRCQRTAKDTQTTLRTTTSVVIGRISYTACRRCGLQTDVVDFDSNASSANCYDDKTRGGGGSLPTSPNPTCRDAYTLYVPIVYDHCTRTHTHTHTHTHRQTDTVDELQINAMTMMMMMMTAVSYYKRESIIA